MINLKLRRALLASTIVAGAQLIVAPAFAQDQTGGAPPSIATEGVTEGVNDQTADAEDVTQPDNPGEITVVTGSLINRNLDDAVPVVSVGQEAVELRQLNTAEEILRDLPGFAPSIGSAVNNGNGGAAYVNLYNLGEKRNLVLIDGRRITASDVEGLTDTNNIPQFMMKRVDVLTGGASTTYGADAMAGVVNFIMDNRFTGLKAEAGEQISQRGDSNTYRADIGVGAELDEGRGNVVLGIGYQHSKPLYQADRKFSEFSVNSITGRSGGSGTGSPSSFFFGPGNANTPANLKFSEAGNYQLNPATGTAWEDDYQLFNFNPYNVLKTPFRRYNIYGSGRYELTDQIETYIRGMYSNNVVETIIAPSGSFFEEVEIPLSNPYMNAGLRNQFCANNDFDSATAGTQILSQAQCDAAALAKSESDPNFTTVTTELARRNVEGGPRVSRYETNFFDLLGGFRGKVTDNIFWDVSGSYSQSHKTQRQTGYWLKSRVQKALMATSTTSCLDADSGACVPLNVFGPEGTITPDMNRYLGEASIQENRTNQIQVIGTISGGTGFTLPWAESDVAFAVGADYRREKAIRVSDALSRSGDLGGAGGTSPDINGTYNVYEGYGEVKIPVAEGRKWVESLNVNAGIRYSRYKVAAEGSPKYHTTTYKAELEWKPIRSVMLRGNYTRAVRAPNISELYTPRQAGLSALQTDPCAGRAAGSNPLLVAVCESQGAPVGSVGSIAQPTAAQARSTFSGSLALKPEKSNSWSVGSVVNIRKWNLSATIDYYHIKIRRAIDEPRGGDIINTCFDNLTANSPSTPACQLIKRNTMNGSLNGGDQIPGLIRLTSNNGRRLTDGINLELNYRTSLIGKLDANISFLGNWTNRSKYAGIRGQKMRECVGYYSTDCESIMPKYSFTQRTVVGSKRWNLGLNWRWVHKVRWEKEKYERSLLTPANDTVLPGNRRIKAYSIFDLSAQVSPTDQFDITFVVQNLADRKPPLVGSSVGATAYNNGNTYPSTYDALGRMFKVAARFRY